MIYTIGHSIHSAVAFGELLQAHEIRQVADVRTIPASRRHPHFTAAPLETFLAALGILYRHFPALGGLRSARADSANTAWTHPAFRGYADYMATQAFREAVGMLLQFADQGRTAVMCAESLWWKCHRRLLADALLVRGRAAYHILSTAPPKPHALSEFARVDGDRISYPGLL